MSEELYQPLPDVEAYLARIGIDQVKEPSPEFLDELIYAHQTHVPFDNLDVYAKGLNPSLAIADLFDKIVVRKRGGYCFEMNAAFGALLKALGFDVRPCMARVLLRPIPYPLISHRANFVTIDGKTYLADVGFGGPMAPFAPLVEDGATRTEDGHTFTLHRSAHSWWDVGYTGSKEEERIVLSVCALRVGEEDFIPLSFYQAQFPESVFRLNRMANIKTEDGAYDLRNMTYTEFRGGEKTVRELESEDEVTRLLEEKFGIVL
ncbi:MAG: arylamine N-acetyltransferase [Eggerthellaceae bacterium]|nr:arylamine N-acetyltransferase [Eggerthellaceae bacterium]